MAASKVRLDVALVARDLVESRSRAQGLIMAGEVLVNGAVVDKAGTRIADGDIITLRSRPRFVSRGGNKLEHALKEFAFDVEGKVCADVGACTGGFTDCLLQRGAGRVYAIDVGYGQLDYRLRTDPRVVVLERTNARYLTALDEPVHLGVIDASFISLQLLLPVVAGWLQPPSDIIALIKPQFEAGKEEVGKGGIVRDTAIHRRVIESVVTFSESLRLVPQGLVRSPITGADGNIEFLIWLSCNPQAHPVDVHTLLKRVLDE